MYKTLKAPLTAQIELSSNCNNNCVHCYNFWRNKKEKISKDKLSSDQIKAILQKLSKANVFDVTITGGEPLLNKSGLLTCLEEAKRFNMGVSMNSNLVPLNPKYAKELYQKGLRNILTSLLGPNAKIHDKIVQQRGAFNKAVQNIKLAMNIGMEVVVNMVISNLNLKHIKSTAKFVSSLGIKKFAATKAGCPGNCFDFTEFSISLTDFRKYLKDLFETEKEYGLKVDVLESYPLCGIKEIDKYRAIMGRKCLAGVTTFTIASDGNVRPCSHLDISYGNILQEDLNAIWIRMEDWRKGKFLPSKCKNCALIALCGGGCRMEAKMKYNALSDLDPYASPKDVDFCLQALRRISKKQPTDYGKFRAFKINKIKWREESFGAIIMAEKKSRVYLDKEGIGLLKQLKEKEVYKLNDKRLNWGALDSSEFISELIQKKVASAVE